MHRRLSGIVFAIVIGASVAACGTSTTSPSPSAASGFDEYATAFCSAWGTLFRVVGNPETAGWTDAVHRLQAAAATRDQATAERLEREINTELEGARQQIAYAAGWTPAARLMAELDRLFAAEEAWITAHVHVARGEANAPDPQTAFEAAGGIAAWQGLPDASLHLAPYRPASVAQCPGAPITP